MSPIQNKDTTSAILQIRGLKKAYGKKEVLKGIDLEVFPGQIIGYIGPNGAGKSTTVKILLGILEDYEGEISIFGKHLISGDLDYRRRIGYVPEVSDLYEVLSGWEYLLFLCSIYELNLDTAKIRIEKMAEVLSLNEVLGSRISTYSKGMRQKLMILASLIHDPDILFLDEPLSGLDANAAMVIKELLFALAKNGKTIFYSSHVMEVVEKISDRILIINDGLIVADGNFESLRAQSDVLNLESLFSKVTGFDHSQRLANQMIDAMKGE